MRRAPQCAALRLLGRVAARATVAVQHTLAAEVRAHLHAEFVMRRTQLLERPLRVRLGPHGDHEPQLELLHLGREQLLPLEL